MGSEWQECLLGDLIELKRGYDLPKKERLPGDIPLVSSSGITDTHANAMIEGPGVVTGRYGTLGKVFYVEQDFWPLNTTLYVRDFKGNDPRFISYFLGSIDFLAYSDKAAVPGLNRNHLHQANVRFPNDVEEQRAIAHILGTLDDKIELNRKQNETLEAMARALFKAWFVDFEPVRAKMEGRWQRGQSLPGLPTHLYDLFPDRLVDSELGEIPQGWEVTSFGAVSNCFDKYRIPLSSKQREARKGAVPYHGATSVMDFVDEAIFNGIYLLLGEDGSVLKEDGTPFIQYIWGESWVNNHAHVLQGANGVSTEHLMLFIAAQNITAYVTGAVQLKLNQKNMNSIPFIKADDEINSKFAALIAPLYEQLRQNTEESRSLAQLRDTLLPKLISGELRIKDAEAFLAERGL